MCGIAGAAGHAPGSEGARAVERMNHALHHRGPDAGGQVELAFAQLAMRRLAIVDVGAGHQPMATADGRFTLVFNGEVYDHAALRAGLEARGARLRTRSDTEVLLERLARDGTEALADLNGMFAFALADTRERSLLLARDPAGIKPLYYHHAADGSLVFASELASLLAHPGVPRRLDRRSLEMLLADRYVADPWTLLEEVRSLPPGHWLRWRGGELAVGRYDELVLEPRRWDAREAAAALEAVLDEAVRSQLVADVPVGVFLSGGIDSSTVAAFAARALAERGDKLATFSIGSSDPAYDESAAARAVARHLGTRHTELRVEDGGFDLDLFDSIVSHVGQPLGDPSLVPTRLVSRLAARELKVCLSGDGGDELFGGYDHLRWAAAVRRASDHAPRAVRRLGAGVLRRVAPFAPRSLAAATRRAAKGLDVSLVEPAGQLRRLRMLFSPLEIAELCAHEGAGEGLRPDWIGDPARIAGLAPEEAAMVVLAGTFLPGAILAKVDRMSMSEGLEVRVPLLDRRVVALARTLPLELKLHGRVGKRVLRDAGRRLLPEGLYHQRKRGFSIPLARWFGPGLFELLEDLYAPGARAAELFRREALERTLATCRTACRGGDEARLGAERAATRVFVLASLARWMERFEVRA